jgi:enterochelin esterase-like enzyme
MNRFLFLLLLTYAGTAQAQLPTVTSGTIRRFADFPSKFVQARNVDVWLPTGYDSTKRYAVLYMHDGQSLFDSTKTWNNQEWGVDELVGKLQAEAKIRPCIVVAVWNTGPFRHADYFPQKPFESLSKPQQDSVYTATRNGKQLLFAAPIQSDKYLKFLVKELKPFIDSHFATYPDRANTFVAGSSMGGLISLYALCEYPAVFGGAACLSTHWPGLFSTENNPVPAAFLQYLDAHLPAPQTHKLYFDYGSETLDSLYAPYQKQADAILKRKGFSAKNWMTRAFPGESHSEQSWRKRLAIPMTFLLTEKRN